MNPLQQAPNPYAIGPPSREHPNLGTSGVHGAADNVRWRHDPSDVPRIPTAFFQPEADSKARDALKIVLEHIKADDLFEVHLSSTCVKTLFETMWHVLGLRHWPALSHMKASEFADSLERSLLLKELKTHLDTISKSKHAELMKELFEMLKGCENVIGNTKELDFETMANLQYEKAERTMQQMFPPDFVKDLERTITHDGKGHIHIRAAMNASPSEVQRLAYLIPSIVYGTICFLLATAVPAAKKIIRKCEDIIPNKLWPLRFVAWVIVSVLLPIPLILAALIYLAKHSVWTWVRAIPFASVVSVCSFSRRVFWHRNEQHRQWPFATDCDFGRVESGGPSHPNFDENDANNIDRLLRYTTGGNSQTASANAPLPLPDPVYIR